MILGAVPEDVCCYTDILIRPACCPLLF